MVVHLGQASGRNIKEQFDHRVKIKQIGQMINAVKMVRKVLFQYGLWHENIEAEKHVV